MIWRWSRCSPGNRNFEGRINPDVKMNYLASPPLVVAYALAGTMDIDLINDSLGTDEQGNDVYLKDIWPTEAEIDEIVASSIGAEMFTDSYADVFAGDEQWQSLPTPEGQIFEWDADSTYVRKPPYFDGMPAEPEPVTDISGARVLLKLGDSITTDHISPAGSIKADAPAGKYLTEHGVGRTDFNSYGSRRGNHEVMIRGTFANIRLRNQLAPGTEGGFTRDFTQTDGPVTTVYEASENYLAAGTPLVILCRQGVRLGFLPGLGGQGHRAARGQGGDRRVVRADPPLQPDRHGCAAAAVPRGPERRVAGPDRRGDLRRSPGSPSSTRGVRPKTVQVTAGEKSASMRWSGSTPRARPTTTATAGSCSTCCGPCSRSDLRGRGGHEGAAVVGGGDRLGGRRARRPDRAAVAGARRCCSCRRRSPTPSISAWSRSAAFDEAGPMWQWNNIHTGEHTGTHLDAPAHWVTGRDGATVDQIALTRLVGPAVVVDVTDEVAANSDFLLEPEHLLAWEQRARPGAGRLLAAVTHRVECSGAGRGRVPQRRRERSAHARGRRWRRPSGWPTSARSPASGWRRSASTPAARARWIRPFPAHYFLLGADTYGLTQLQNLDRLPSPGAVLVVTPLPIVGGTGSPARVVALVEHS